ncbi:MAG: ankyrin repeat domain-containing protein [Myxococcales bacterium]|nr:ankyrin repeat domain-containing protein [Myxococcales bacterium]
MSATKWVFVATFGLWCACAPAPLIQAVRQDDPVATALLLESGQDVDQRQQGKTALMWALEEDNVATAISLVEHHASVVALDDRKWTVLHYAACGSPKTRSLIPLILQEGGIGVIDWLTADTGETALHCVAKQGDRVSVRILLMSGADLGARNRLGQTPYDVALAAGYGSLATSIISREGRLLRCPRPLSSPPRGERTAADACEALQFELDASVSESSGTCRPLHECVHERFSFKRCLQNVEKRTSAEGISCRKACPMGPNHPYCKVWCDEELWRPLQGLFEVCAREVADE